MGDRLTTLEASFLALERRGLPMHVAGLVVFEPTGRRRRITAAELTAFITPRLRGLPALQKRVALAPLGLARAEWVPVERVNLKGHVYRHHLAAPGSRRQLEELCGLIHEGLLPRDRPLWQIHLIDGLEGGRQALLVKVHHAVIDGIGGLQLARSLLDRRRRPRLAARGTRRVRVRKAGKADWHEGLEGMAHVVADGPLALPGPFNGWVGSRRAFAIANLSMDDVHLVKARLGVSSDDVLLTAVAGGLQSYFRESRVRAPKSMRAMVPASTRGAGMAKTGVHVTSIFIDLPLDSSSLPDRARKISVSKAVLKSAHAGIGFAMLADLAGNLPASLHESLVRFAGRMPFANLVMSDVPGPLEQQVFLGRQIEAGYPLLPLPARVGVAIAAIRVGATMGIGITADPRHLHDASRLARSIERAMSALLAEAVREGEEPMPRGLLPKAA